MNFRLQRRNYTIPEGHYTGPKEMEDVPGMVEMVGKGAGIGALIGGTIGHFKEDSTAISGMITGGKFGALGGLATKLIINKLHNPMKTVKYQEVDKLIRREFGVYSMSGITVGDSRTKRRTIEEKFSFGDRNVTDYKINIAIYNDSVTMYTLGMTDAELSDTSKVLDHYCKKYYGMEYVSKAINNRVNSYSVTITFTNYYVINSFIQELSERLGCKINLLDNKPLVDSRIEREDEDEDDHGIRFSRQEREFSRKWGNGEGAAAALAITIGLWYHGKGVGKLVAEYLKNRKLDNNFLESVLERLHYSNKKHYKISLPNETKLREDPSQVFISLQGGLFLVSVHKDSEEYKKVESWYKKIGGDRIKEYREETPEGIIIYQMPVGTINNLEYMLKLMISSSKITPVILYVRK